MVQSKYYPALGALETILLTVQVHIRTEPVRTRKATCTVTTERHSDTLRKASHAPILLDTFVMDDKLTIAVLPFHF